MRISLLYLLTGLESNFSDANSVNELKSFIKFTNIFLVSEENDKELIDDAKALLK